MLFEMRARAYVCVCCVCVRACVRIWVCAWLGLPLHCTVGLVVPYMDNNKSDHIYCDVSIHHITIKCV